MRIGFFIEHFGKGGVERVVQSLSNYLTKQGHQVYIFVLTRLPNEYDLDARVQLVAIDKHAPMSETLRHLETYHLAIYSLHFYWLAYCYELADALVAGGKKVTLTEHSVFFQLYRDILSPFVAERKPSWQKVNVLTVLSGYDYQIHGAVLDNVAYMPNPNTFSASLPLQTTYQKNIIVVSRLAHHKRVDRALRAFALIANTHTDWQLLVLGDGDLRVALEKLAKALGVFSQVNFVGNVKNVADYYAKSSIHLMTSQHEGWGLALTEAKQFAVPSVVMDAPCFHDLIQDGVDGLIVAQDDIQAMADKIKFFIENPDACKAMGKNAKARVQAYDINVVGKRWENLFSLILEKPQAIINQELKTVYAPVAQDNKKIIADFVQEYNILYTKLCILSKYNRLRAFLPMDFLLKCVTVFDFIKAVGFRVFFARVLFHIHRIAFRFFK
jgi:glycosyltransferase involved in cell wall biosynthesis